jgi:hypothetical protein
MFVLPLFGVAWKVEGQPPDVAFHDLATATEPKGSSALVLFTDRVAAEKFRDNTFPTYQVFEVTTPSMLVDVLRALHVFTSVMVVDLVGSRRGSLRLARYSLKHQMRNLASGKETHYTMPSIS